MRTDGSFDWGIITANAQKWANSEYILEIEKDSLDTEENSSKKQTTPPLPYGIGVVSRVIRYQYFFTNILKATNIGLSPPNIAHSTHGGVEGTVYCPFLNTYKETFSAKPIFMAR